MAEKPMNLDYLSILTKLCLAALPTFAFWVIVVTIDCMFNEGDLERRFDYLFPCGLIFFAAVYLWQNR
jgi:hypothetical protein